MNAAGRIGVADRLLRAGSAPLAVALLVAANLLPLVGVLFFGWDVLSVLVLYWIESGIVGLLNVAKMARAEGTAADGPLGALAALNRPAKLVLIPFFALHYGIFWAVHGAFVFLIPTLAGAGPGDASGSIIAIGALALTISHGASFVLNYLGRGEYRRATVAGLFLAPYARVFVLHITVVLGGFVTFVAGGPVAMIVLLVVLKTAIDLVLHLREHRRAARRPVVPA